jgi:transcriptional accessory protein Tex/SPT6
VLPLKYPVGARLNGKVRNLTSFGAFVEIEPGIDGLIHISDMSWTKRVQHPSEVVKKGDSVDVVILSIDADNKRISLGLKQATEDPWLRIGETYPVGTELPGKVARLMEKGVVVDIGNDIEGFVPLSHLPSDKVIESPADVCYDGMNLELRVVEVDPIHRRIVLTEHPRRAAAAAGGTGQDPLGRRHPRDSRGSHDPGRRVVSFDPSPTPPPSPTGAVLHSGRQTVGAVETRHLVRLGEGRIVEYGVAEVLNRPA